ncbi:MAG: LamB/YcsF family protein [Rhodospirillaceae bacterium]|nr:LamB/YcsF family protein [Rhodospirillaceae bacterium]
MARTFDINIDCGESFGNWNMGADEALMPHITTANMACGFHAGDPMTMVKTVRLAKQHGVAVGAHPGLADLLGFGRRTMALSPEEVYADTLYQTGALSSVLKAHDMELHHVKPHGALYSMLSASEALGEAFARAVIEICPEPMIYYPAPVENHAVTRIAADMGIDVVPELYFDLSYDDVGGLILKRANEGADLADTKLRLARFLESGEVLSVNDKPVAMTARSICLHGDGPNAVDLARTICDGLAAADYTLAPLVPTPTIAGKAA